MRFLLLIALLLAGMPAFAADSLDCELARKDEKLKLSAAILDGQSSLATDENELGLGLDASLAPSSFFLVLQDDRLQRRVAFTASPLAVAGSVLSSGDGRVECARHNDNPPKAMPVRPEMPDYFVCVLDEAVFENGIQVSSKRLLRKAVHTALFRQLPQLVLGESGKVSFGVRFHRADFLRGLSVQLTDAATGASAQYKGPSGALSTSFMIALTQGNRNANAVFHRLGCAFSASPDALD